MPVPGDGITALHKAGAIPDPFRGRNEYGLRWIAERDWTIRREVMLDRTDLALVVEMLDTVADVRVNGKTVLRADNMFRTRTADISSVARVGPNVIEIIFRSVVREGAARQAAQPFPAPYHKGNCPIPNGNMIRKPQCDFGWDWNIALAPFGIYGEILLRPLGQPRVTDIVLGQRHEAGRVTVTVSAGFENVAEGQAVRLLLAGESAAAQVSGSRIAATLTLESPALWWPNGLGDQTLHLLTLETEGVTATRRIGLRSVELLTTPDATGARFAFRINGREVFMRGANWIPADALGSAITPQTVRPLLTSARDAHMNMIRVWGGGRYEPDWFYDLCDELGLMVWQDFMFACHLYPSTEAFLAEVGAEVREQVLRLHHHACLALWCGDNELLGALRWFPESVQNRDRYLVAYDRLNRTIEKALREADPGAVWWPSSPSPGPFSFGDAWHDDRSGDMHFWSVWHEGRDFDHYRDVTPRFCSEFGFQSYPSLSAIRRFADQADWNIASPVMESHQKNAGGNARIAETMFRYFRFPSGFENFVYLSQIQQGLAIKTAVSHWRSLKPHCMGTLYWQLNDTWPVCSWSSLDHGGNWKLLHYMAVRFYAPVFVSVVPVSDGYQLRAVNDGPGTVALSLQVAAARMDGSTRPLGETRISLGTESAQVVADVAADALAADEILALTWQASDGTASGDIFAPKPWKAYDLLPPHLSHRVAPAGDGFSISMTVDALAAFVAVEADVPGRFSANAVTLFPGHEARITFMPDAPGTLTAPPVFTFRDLHSATYGTERTR